MGRAADPGTMIEPDRFEVRAWPFGVRRSRNVVRSGVFLVRRSQNEVRTPAKSGRAPHFRCAAGTF
jgi:hypothetical protein